MFKWLMERAQAREDERIQKEVMGACDFIMEEATTAEILELAYHTLNARKSDMDLHGTPAKISAYGRMVDAQLAIWKKMTEVENVQDPDPNIEPASVTSMAHFGATEPR